MRILVVKSPFDGHEVGDEISGEDDVESILEGEHAHHVLVSIRADKTQSVNAEED